VPGQCRHRLTHDDWGEIERVIPAEIVSAPALPREQAHSALLLTARAPGVATVTDLADYFRLPVAETGARAHELAEDGRLRTAIVAAGTSAPTYTPNSTQRRWPHAPCCPRSPR
jgi:uncharacterized protein